MRQLLLEGVVYNDSNVMKASKHFFHYEFWGRAAILA